MNLTVRRPMRPRYRAQEGGFAGAIGAYQGDRLTLIDQKAYLADGFQQSMSDIEATD